MGFSRFTLWIFLFLLPFGRWATAQTIWPGDVNNNGEVTIVDVLYHGLAFGATGPVRPGATTEWEGQPAGMPWSQNFPNGLNYYYADGDGNGIVEDEDLDEAIRENFGEQHGTFTGDGFAAGTPGSAPTVRLQPVSGVVPTGGLIEIDLILEGSDAPLEDFYGLALQLSYQVSGEAEIDDFDFTPTAAPWYDPSEVNSVEFFISDDDENTASLAVVRKDQLTVSGEGQMGRFSVVIEDIIAIEQLDTFVLSVDSVMVIGADFSPRAVVADQTRVIVADDTSSVTATIDSQLQAPASLRIYPNPVRSHCRVVTTQQVERWQLISLTGHTYELTSAYRNGADYYDISLPGGLPGGIYFLRAFTGQGLLQQRIILHS